MLLGVAADLEREIHLARELLALQTIHMSRFHKVPPAILADIANSAQIQEVAEAVQHSQIDTEIAWTCLQCRIDAFDSLADMRLHHKTDWHLYNVHRSLKALGPVTQDEYDATDDLSSIDGSEDDQDDPNHQDSILASGSPYVRFVYDQTVNGVSRPFQLSVFKQVLLSRKSNMLVPSEWVDALVRAQSSGQKTWVLMMLASGHFSGAVLDLSTGKAIATKSFHRYTTRKKQGGAQSGYFNLM